MKKSKPTISQQIQPAIRFVKKYKKFLFTLTVMGLVGFLVFQINQLASSEPTDTMIEERLQTVTRPKLDQAVIDRIQQLEDQNVEVQSLFDQARNNPFDE